METIHRFNSMFLAFFRPIKRTFYLMRWNTDVNRWEYYTGEHTPFTLHKSSRHTTNGSVVIRMQTARQNTTDARIGCDGSFLKNGDLMIPIAKIVGTAPPPSRIKQEYTLRERTDEYGQYIISQRLWTVAPVAPPAPAAPAALTEAPRLKVVLAPIPRRIAWIIAEDSCKNKESCSISLEEISPITASVTSCFHVFESASLKTWFETKGSKNCPVCRNPCEAQDAFEQMDNPSPNSGIAT